MLKGCLSGEGRGSVIGKMLQHQYTFAIINNFSSLHFILLVLSAMPPNSSH